MIDVVLAWTAAIAVAWVGCYLFVSWLVDRLTYGRTVERAMEGIDEEIRDFLAGN